MAVKSFVSIASNADGNAIGRAMSFAVERTIIRVCIVPIFTEFVIASSIPNSLPGVAKAAIVDSRTAAETDVGVVDGVAASSRQRYISGCG